MTAPSDVAVIGGGVNGAGIARDAAGRGLKVLLVERADLASATSSASTKLIHGGLRYLEHRAFCLVRHALEEREVLWAMAPHIVWPLRFVLPYRPGLRPAWVLRAGLFLYDRIGGRKRLPPTRRLRLDRDPAGPSRTAIPRSPSSIPTVGCRTPASWYSTRETLPPAARTSVPARRWSRRVGTATPGISSSRTRGRARAKPSGHAR